MDLFCKGRGKSIKANLERGCRHHSDSAMSTASIVRRLNRRIVIIDGGIGVYKTYLLRALAQERRDVLIMTEGDIIYPFVETFYQEKGADWERDCTNLFKLQTSCIYNIAARYQQALDVLDNNPHSIVVLERGFGSALGFINMNRQMLSPRDFNLLSVMAHHFKELYEKDVPTLYLLSTGDASVANCRAREGRLLLPYTIPETYLREVVEMYDNAYAQRVARGDCIWRLDTSKYGWPTREAMFLDFKEVFALAEEKMNERLQVVDMTFPVLASKFSNEDASTVTERRRTRVRSELLKLESVSEGANAESVRQEIALLSHPLMVADEVGSCTSTARGLENFMRVTGKRAAATEDAGREDPTGEFGPGRELDVFFYKFVPPQTRYPRARRPPFRPPEKGLSGPPRPRNSRLLSLYSVTNKEFAFGKDVTRCDYGFIVTSSHNVKIILVSPPSPGPGIPPACGKCRPHCCRCGGAWMAGPGSLTATPVTLPRLLAKKKKCIIRTEKVREGEKTCLRSW